MFKKLLLAGLLVSASASAWAQSGQLGTFQLWGNPTASQAPSKPSNVGSFLTQGTGVTISGTPKATIGITNTITAAGPSGSATQTPVITYNAQGQLTLVTLATIAPPFSALTGSLACTQEPAHTGDTTSPAGSCANTTVKVNGVAFGTSPSTDTIPVITAANTATYTALPNCTSGLLQYATATHLFSCGAAGSGTVNTAGTGLSLSGGGTTVNLALTNATLDANPVNPTATTSTTGVMMGMGTTCKITPVYSGRVKVTFNASFQNNGTSGGNATAIGRFADNAVTATPANAAAPVGTVFGNSSGIVGSGGTTLAVPYSSNAIITGLTVGHLYWFDQQLAANVGTNSVDILNPHCAIEEF